MVSKDLQENNINITVAIIINNTNNHHNHNRRHHLSAHTGNQTGHLCRLENTSLLYYSNYHEAPLYYCYHLLLLLLPPTSITARDAPIISIGRLSAVLPIIGTGRLSAD